MNSKKLILILLLMAAFALSASPALAGSPPDAVPGVDVTRSDGTVTASWVAPTGATKYHVTYSDNGGASWSLAAYGEASTSVSFSADNAKTYVVGVRAGNDHGWSTSWTNSPPAGPYVPPRPPANVGAVDVTRADGSLTASWDAVDRATKHHVTYTSDNGASWSLAALEHPSNSITISADNAKTYVVGVRAGNDHGWSGSWTNSPPAGPYVPPKPAPAPSVAAERGSDLVSAIVKWTAYAGTDFSHYQVVVCTDEQYDGASCSGTVYKSGGFYDAGFTGPVSVTDLDAQTGYGVILQTWRKGDAVHKSHATIPALSGLPVAPDGLTVTPGSGNLTVSWDAVSGATGYDVRVKANGAADWTNVAGNIADTSYKYVTNDTIDHVGVRARNSDGASAWTTKSRGVPPIDWLAGTGASAVGGASVQSAQAQNQPAAPASVTVTRDNNTRDEKLHVSWTAVTGATGYNVACTPNNGWSWWHCGTATSGSTTTLTVDDQEDGTDLGWARPYAVSVQAVKNAVPGPWVMTETAQPAIKPHLLSITATRSTGSITLTWPRGNPANQGYEIECATGSGGGTHRLCADVDTATPGNDGMFTQTLTSWTVSGTNYSVDNTQTYDIIIRHTNQWGNSEFSVAPMIHPYHNGGSADLFVSAVSATSATLSIKDYVGDWWYKANTGPDSTCQEGAWRTDQSLTGLTVGETYNYSAYSDSRCTQSLATASTYTVGVSVSNLSQTSDGYGDKVFTGNARATGFTTGGNSGGYTLHSVTVKFRASSGSPGTLSVGIRTESGGNPTRTTTYFLSGDAPTTAGDYTYTCSGSCSLSANTTYFLVIAGTSPNQFTGYFDIDTTASATETNTPSNAGWSIANNLKRQSTGNNWTDASGWTGIFKVSATPNLGLAASNFSATGATLTIGGHTGAWWYKSTTTGKTACESAGSGKSVSVTGLTAGSSYTFSAYSDSTCTTGNLLATASSFTAADPSLTVSNVGTTTARITIGNHTGQWWYKATTAPHTTCQGPVAAGTSYKDLTGLTAGAAYLYSAYSATGCASGNLLATASSFTTSASVSNLSAAATSIAPLIYDDQSAATAFTTGANSGGYTLQSVTVKIRTVGNNAGTLTAAIHAVSGGNPASTATHTLSGSSPTGAGSSTFTCSGGCGLSANTTYFLVLTGTGTSAGRSFTWDTTASTSETNTPSGFGWSIADKGKTYASGAWGDVTEWTGIFGVSATPKPSLTASGVSASGATLTIANYSGAWWYKSTTTGKTTCESAGSNASASVTGLTAGSSYTFSAYSDSACTSGNLLATASSFTAITPTLTVSNVGTTTARITSNHSGQWWYKATTAPHTTCQGPVAAGTSYKDLTGLTAGATYLYSAYSATGCASGNLLATAESFTTAVSVSNLSQSFAGNVGVSNGNGKIYANQFRTGGNSGKYTLSGVTVDIGGKSGSVGALQVEVWSDSSGNPGSKVSGVTLTANDSTASSGNLAYSCSGACTLDPSTNYWVRLSASGSGQWSWSYTNSAGETLDPSGNGWQINDNKVLAIVNSNVWVGANGYFKLKVEAVPNPSLLATGVTATGATLTISNHLGEWWYKSATTGKTTCESAGSGASASVSGLTSGTDYVFSAYGDSACTSGNLLATAAQFTTP